MSGNGNGNGHDERRRAVRRQGVGRRVLMDRRSEPERADPPARERRKAERRSGSKRRTLPDRRSNGRG